MSGFVLLSDEEADERADAAYEAGFTAAVQLFWQGVCDTLATTAESKAADCQAGADAVAAWLKKEGTAPGGPGWPEAVRQYAEHGAWHQGRADKQAAEAAQLRAWAGEP